MRGVKGSPRVLLMLNLNSSPPGALWGLSRPGWARSMHDLRLVGVVTVSPWAGSVLWGPPVLLGVLQVWEGRWRVIPYDVLPDWLKDNDYLLHGHRPPMPSFRACFKSIFRIHTETGNIWTHLLGDWGVVGSPGAAGGLSQPGACWVLSMPRASLGGWHTPAWS